jgi:ubiquinone/menaquinone biosynthesis C-methylase UbiE
LDNPAKYYFLEITFSHVLFFYEVDSFLQQFLPLTRCPISGSLLRPATASLVNALNERIRQNDVKHADGSDVQNELTEALVSEDNRFVYQIIDHQIVVLLEPLAIVNRAGNEPCAVLDEQKKSVLDFYNEFGWKKDKSQLFKDTVTFEDRREVVSDYWSKCHLRLNKYLPGGQYILDVASGAIPNDEYLTYSNNYQLRICMDFSLLAMQEAVQRLNGKGVFILGDMTNIPLADRCLDAVISLHTVYHVPKVEQTRAVAQAYRVLKPGRQAVIVYSWSKPPLIYWTMKGWRTLLRLLHKRKKPAQPSDTKSAPSRPDLFTHQQGYDWFARELRRPFNAQLRVYSAISRSFSNTFIREKAFGKFIAKGLYHLENLFPALLGRWGQYPVFILKKPQATASINAPTQSFEVPEPTKLT